MFSGELWPDYIELAKIDRYMSVDGGRERWILWGNSGFKCGHHLGEIISVLKNCVNFLVVCECVSCLLKVGYFKLSKIFWQERPVLIQEVEVDSGPRVVTIKLFEIVINESLDRSLDDVLLEDLSSWSSVLLFIMLNYELTIDVLSKSVSQDTNGIDSPEEVRSHKTSELVTKEEIHYD